MVGIEEELASFFIDNGMVKGIPNEDKAYMITHIMEHLEENSNPNDFKRINRQFILQSNSIEQIDHYFSGKLKIKTEPQLNDELMVSKVKTYNFKSGKIYKFIDKIADKLYKLLIFFFSKQILIAKFD